MRSSFIVIIAFSKNYWCIKTLLSGVSHFPLHVIKPLGPIHHTGLSQYPFGVHPTHMDTSTHRGCDEYIFWIEIET
jgi:hypothetical protein